MISKMYSKPSSGKANLPTIGDLHVRKESHMAMPMAGNEWHFKAADINVPCVPGKTYTLCVSVMCTSGDEEGVRFRQIAKYFIGKGSAFDQKFKTDGGK